ncbi:MAG TPA: alpha/beta hydrolase [Candidatus Anoxymicrobiaceae bacterium]
MENPRTHGEAPFGVAVLHGGPGAAGEVAPVATELGRTRGTLEPFQTKLTVDGQIEELGSILTERANLPIVLVGYSWGAMLALVFAARNPTAVKKLILVSSGALEEKSAVGITRTRLSRMTDEQRAEFRTLSRDLQDPACRDRNAVLGRLGALLVEVDSFDPLPHDDEIDYRYDIFESVWTEAAGLRAAGKFMEMARDIRCPVVAIHGDYDPHPAESIEGPLSGSATDRRFIILPQCGHKPWIERRAKQMFYDVLLEELGQGL